MSIDQSKLLEWLIDNDCPYEWVVDDYFVGDGVKIQFYDKEPSNEH